jgi:hypothetical protein
VDLTVKQKKRSSNKAVAFTCKGEVYIVFLFSRLENNFCCVIVRFECIETFVMNDFLSTILYSFDSEFCCDRLPLLTYLKITFILFTLIMIFCAT